MGAHPSTSCQPCAGEKSGKKAEKLPPAQKKNLTPKMSRRDLEKADGDMRNDTVRAPTKLPALDVDFTSKDNRYDLATPDVESSNNASTKASAHNMPNGLPSTTKALNAQISLSTSTQRQYGLSDNVSQRSNSFSDEEWNPPEFGPLVESFDITTARHSADTNDSARASLDDDEDGGFYLHFVQLNGAASTKAQRTVSVKELLEYTSSTENARTRFLMNGGDIAGEAIGRSPNATPGASDDRQQQQQQQQQRKSRYAVARERGPVDTDQYIDALYLHSRERERTHFFIDPDGEIRRLYHTEGWHTLGSTKRRKDLLRRRSNSGDDSSSGSHHGHRSHKSHANSSSGSITHTKSSSGYGPGLSSTAGVGMPTASSPSEQLSGAAFQLRNTRFGSSGLLTSMNAPPYTPTPAPAGDGKGAAGTTNVAAATASAKAGSPHGYTLGHDSPTPQKTTSPLRSVPSGGPEGTDSQVRHTPSTQVPLTESAASVSLGSGRASTLPGSHGAGDFFSQAFGGTAGVTASPNDLNRVTNAESIGSGVTPPSILQPRISSILVRPDGDFPGSTSRRGSFSSMRHGGDGNAGDQSRSPSPRSRLSTRRVSFSQGTLYFKKDPFYITPHSDKGSEYTDLTPPEESLREPVPPSTPPSEAPRTADLPSAAAAPNQPKTSPSYVQLTLLKDKMTQNRERNLM